MVVELCTAVVAIEFLTHIRLLTVTGTTRRVDGIQFTIEVATNAVITCQTIGNTNLELANPIELLHERLLREHPCTRYRGEIAPLITRSKLRGTVSTHGS